MGCSTSEVKTAPECKYQTVTGAVFAGATSHLRAASHPWLLCSCRSLTGPSLRSTSPHLLAQTRGQAVCTRPASPRGSPDDSDTPLSHAPFPRGFTAAGRSGKRCQPWAWGEVGGDTTSSSAPLLPAARFSLPLEIRSLMHSLVLSK